MSSQFKVTGIRPYARELVEPYVQQTLHTLGGAFECRPEWRSSSSSAKTATLLAAPLSPDAGAALGYGRRTGAAMSMSAIADVAYGEYTWMVGGIGNSVVQGEPEGLVELTCTIHTRFGVESGDLADDIGLPDGDTRKSFLCRAEEYTLPDGTSCMAIKTFMGILWFHTTKEQYWWNRLQGLSTDAFQWRKTRTVRLAVTGSSDTYPELNSLSPGYWDGLKTGDTAGRIWRIAKSVVQFSCDMRLEVVGRYNTRLKEKPDILTLLPPYYVAWSPEVVEKDQPRLLIPLTFN